MGQPETPDNWRVERNECCPDGDVIHLERIYGEYRDLYQCPECEATYQHDGSMVDAPGATELIIDEQQQRLGGS